MLNKSHGSLIILSTLCFTWSSCADLPFLAVSFFLHPLILSPFSVRVCVLLPCKFVPPPTGHAHLETFCWLTHLFCKQPLSAAFLRLKRVAARALHLLHALFYTMKLVQHTEDTSPLSGLTYPNAVNQDNQSHEGRTLTNLKGASYVTLLWQKVIPMTHRDIIKSKNRK